MKNLTLISVLLSSIIFSVFGQNSASADSLTEQLLDLDAKLIERLTTPNKRYTPPSTVAPDYEKVGTDESGLVISDTVIISEEEVIVLNEKQPRVEKEKEETKIIFTGNLFERMGSKILFRKTIRNLTDNKVDELVQRLIRIQDNFGDITYESLKEQAAHI